MPSETTRPQAQTRTIIVTGQRLIHMIQGWRKKRVVGILIARAVNILGG